MQNSAAGGTEETLTRAFALILVSFSYSGGKNTSHFHHSSILCTQTYIRLSSILLKYLYKIHCSPFIFSICRVIFLLIIRVRTVNLWQSNGFIHVCVCQGGESLRYCDAETLLLHKWFHHRGYSYCNWCLSSNSTDASGNVWMNVTKNTVTERKSLREKKKQRHDPEKS